MRKGVGSLSSTRIRRELVMSMGRRPRLLLMSGSAYARIRKINSPSFSKTAHQPRGVALRLLTSVVNARGCLAQREMALAYTELGTPARNYISSCFLGVIVPQKTKKKLKKSHFQLFLRSYSATKNEKKNHSQGSLSGQELEDPEEPLGLANLIDVCPPVQQQLRVVKVVLGIARKGLGVNFRV